MKITFCMYQFVMGGIEKSLLQILTEMLKSNICQISIVVRKPHVEKDFADFCNRNKIKLDIIPYQEITYDKAKTSFLKKFFIKVFNKIQKIRSKHFLQSLLKGQDLVIDYFNCSFYDLLKKINIPKIGWYHSSFKQYEKNFLRNNKKYARLYDCFVVITKSFQSKLITDKYIGAKTVQIYNPFNIAKIKKQAIQADYPKDEKYFTFVARFHDDKDHQTIIDAFEHIFAKFPDVKIYFVGDGETKSHYEKIVRNKNLQNNLIFCGKLANPLGYIQHATANILSSPSEGLSNILVEGAILGTLNIASDCPSGPAEILLNGKGGVLYPVGDNKKLAQIMEDVLENKINTQELINNADKEINRFDSTEIAKQILTLCHQVITNKEVKSK